MQEIKINSNDSGQRLDKFITKKFRNIPFSLMYKLIRKKKITVNRKRTKENYILQENDIILIFAPDEVLSDAPQKRIRKNSNINVRYEDENIIIVDKESGLIVHSGEGEDQDTLIDRITSYLYERGEYEPDKENSFAPALCNRIDRNTQGLVIAAKNAKSLREMNEIIKNRYIEKVYLAAIHGVIEPKHGVIKLLLEKDRSNNIVHVRERANSRTKTAITNYKTVSVNSKNKLSLIEIELITGRTHQIRASFAHIGHPLLGDGKYAVNKKDREIGYSSQALCAYSIKFSNCKKMEHLSYLEGLVVTANEPEFLKLF